MNPEPVRSWATGKRARGVRAFARLTLGLGLLFCGCNNNEHENERERLCAVQGCTRGCEELEVAACDISDDACRELVFQSVRCVRGGWLTTRPETDVKASFTADALPTVSTNSTKERAGEPIRLKAVDDALRLLKLLGAAATQEDAAKEANAGIVAQFDPEQQRVTVLQDENSVQWLSMLTLAHEYIHSMQFAEEPQPDMVERLGSSAATRQGVRALIEGEAQVYGHLVYAFMKRADIREWDLPKYFRWQLKQALVAVAQAESPWYLAVATLHYPVGLRYVWELWNEQGHVGVRDLRGNLDVEVGKWTFGYPLAGAIDLQWSPAFFCNRPKLLPEYSWIATDSLGPSGIFAFAVGRLDASLGVPLEPAWELAQAARGDQFRIYARRDAAVGVTEAEPFADLVVDGNVVVEWVLRFDSVANAQLFAEAARKQPQAQVTRDGLQVSLLLGRDELPAGWTASHCTPN